MTGRVLEAPPALAGLYARAAASLLPLRRLTGAAPATVAHTDVDLSALTVRLAGVRADPAGLARYRRVCGYSPAPVAATLPATYPHVLAFPLHLLVMTDARFPLPPLGAVHIANTITQLRPIGADEIIDLVVSATSLRPHARGRQVTLVSRAEVGGVVVWRGETVLLHRESPPAGVQTTVAPGGPPVPRSVPTGPMTWELPSDLGRRYAAVSGDRNPLHLYDLTARPLGFSRHIAHGMWTKARCLAELSNRLDGRFTVSLTFAKPVTLPGTVGFGARVDGESIDFAVTSAADGRPHLLGRVTPD